MKLPAILLLSVLAPPCPAEEPQVFEAAKFGVVGDGIHDDGPAVLSMLDAAMKAGKPAVLRIVLGNPAALAILGL
jgi:hypothetical protein